MVVGAGGVRGTSEGVVAGVSERDPCVWAGAGQSWGQLRQEPGKIYITIIRVYFKRTIVFPPTDIQVN